MSDKKVQLSSQNMGDAIHLIMNAIPRALLVKIHERDEEAITAAVYWLSHTEMSLPAKGLRDIPGMYLITFNRKQIVALVDMVFAILVKEEQS